MIMFDRKRPERYIYPKVIAKNNVKECAEDGCKFLVKSNKKRCPTHTDMVVKRNTKAYQDRRRARRRGMI